MSDQPPMERPWRLALIVDDAAALKVAVAYYSVPRRQRGDLAKLAEISGVSQDVQAALSRLDAAGMLAAEMPKALEMIVNKWVLKKLKE